MSLVNRSFRRELADRFQEHNVRVFANGRVFEGRLRRIGRDFVTLRNTRKTAIRIPRIIAVSRRRG